MSEWEIVKDNDWEISKPEDKNNNVVSGVPLWMQNFMKMFPDMISGNMGNRAQAMGEGFKNIGRGAKQAGLSAGENLGLIDQGTSDKYTQENDQLRNNYANSPAANDQYANFLKNQVEDLPALLMGGPLLGGEASLIKKMIAGSGIGAGVGASKYVGGDEDSNTRQANILKDTLLGAGLPAIQQVPKSATNVIDKVIKPLFYKQQPKEIAKIIQSGHDTLDKEASDIFDYVSSQAKERGLNTLPIPKDIINKSTKYLPNTKSSKELIEKASTGDYESLRKLQTDLRTRAKQLNKSPFKSEKDRGEEATELRDTINQEIGDSFEILGHPDLKSNLNKARGLYRQLKELYYQNSTIEDLVDPKLRKVPKNIISVVAEDSIPMKAIRERHPELIDHINLHNASSKSKALLKLLGAGSIGGATVYGLGKAGSAIHYLNELLKK